MTGNSSFQCVVRQLDNGDSVAAAKIHDRFVSRLVWLAQQRMEPKLRSKFDPSDVVQSVFQSFYRRQADGQFEHTSWGSLWALLAQITVRKCGRRATKYHAARRDIQREVPLNGTSSNDGTWLAPSREPLPEEVAGLEDTMTRLMSALDPEQRQIVALKLQNYSHEEIARRVDRTQRTVCRVLKRVRESLTELNAELDIS